MPEHRIKFRGGWESSGTDAEASRLSLPIAWPEGASGTIELTRRFGRPPIGLDTESAWLELRFVSGLRSARLNRVELDFRTSRGADWRVPLRGILEARNLLSLEVDLGLVDRDETSGGWGWIALVIAPISPAGDRGEPAGGVGTWAEMP